MEGEGETREERGALCYLERERGADDKRENIMKKDKRMKEGRH